MLAVRNGRDGLAWRSRAPGEVDVGRVVGADRRRDGRIVEQPLAKRQGVVGAGGHQHDVDQPRPRDQPHLLAVFFERLEADLAGVHLGRPPGRAEAEGHVGVLGVGDDELAAARDRRGSPRACGREISPWCQRPLPCPETVTRELPIEPIAAARPHRDPHGLEAGCRLVVSFGSAVPAGWPCAAALGLLL